MILLLLRRRMQSIVTLLVSVLRIFFLFGVIPGSFLNTMGGEKRNIDAVLKARMQAELNLDAPVHERLGSYLVGLAKGDLGTSFALRRPVADVLGERLVASLRLAVGAIVFALALMTLLGPGLPRLFIALGLTDWACSCRISRAQVLTQKSQN